MNTHDRPAVARSAALKVAAAWILLPLFFLAPNCPVPETP